MQLFYSDKRLQEIFFQNHPPPPEELHGRPLSCLVPQLVPGPHYYSARPERLGSRGPNEEQANGGEVGGWKRFRIFLQRFLYGFKSTLQKGNVQLKKVLN